MLKHILIAIGICSDLFLCVMQTTSAPNDLRTK